MTPRTADISGIMLAGSHVWNRDAFDTLLPRPLITVANSPTIAYAARWLSDGGVSQATVCMNAGADLFRRCLGDGGALGLDLYYYEDHVPRGPAGFIADAAQQTEGEQIVVIDATIIPALNLEYLLAWHVASEADATVVVTHANPGGSRFDELPRPLGIYVFDRDVLEHVPPTGYQDIKEAFLPRLHAAEARVLAFETEDVAPQITGLESYLAANRWVLSRLLRIDRGFEGYRRTREAWVHESAEVAPDAHLLGVTLIGPRTRVESNAVVVGPTVIGSDCCIGRGALVCRSILWDECAITDGGAVDQVLLVQGSTVDPEPLRANHRPPRATHRQREWRQIAFSGSVS